MKKPILIEDKDREIDDSFDCEIKYYKQISYCPICDKKSMVDYLTYTVENDYYEYGDADFDLWHHWTWIEPSELEIAISQKEITLYNGDYTNEDEPMEIKKAGIIPDKLMELYNIIEKEEREYQKRFKRGKGSQPALHFCSKTCAKKFILSKLRE